MGVKGFPSTALMADKTIKTREELAELVMAELCRHPECREVEGVAITHQAGKLWDVLPLDDGSHIDTPCWKIIHEVRAKLCDRYELSDED
jgi:hypothetical protein